MLFRSFERKNKNWRQIGNDLYANRLKQEVTAHHWNKGERKLSQSITNQWGSTPFEDWLEESVSQYWMTAEWFQVEKPHPGSDFAFLVSVHVPIFIPQEEFDKAYGESFVMTKLMHY